MTKFKQPTEKEWKRLYELAVKVKALAPWEWMYEDNIFGVQNPETQEIGFVSVMGIGGEHLGISVYLGAEGLFGFDGLHHEALEEMENDDENYEDMAMKMFEIPQLQASFENRQQLEKADHDVLKKLGLKFRGSQNYPLFRSIVPGFLPYYITSDEARFLIYVLEQLLEVAPRLVEDDSILEDTDIDDEFASYLVRIPSKESGKIVWNEEHLVIRPPSETEISVPLPDKIMSQVKNLPQNKNLVVQIDLFYSPMPVGGKRKRPFIPKMLMVADSKSGVILGFQVMQPQESEQENFSQLIENIFDLLTKLNVRPIEIQVSSEELFELFKGFIQLFNIRLKQIDELEAIEAAKEGMFEIFGKMI